MKQARSEARKQAKIRQREKAAELQMALEDRAAARRLLLELAEADREHRRWAARFQIRVRPEKPQAQTSPIIKRSVSTLPAGARAAAGSRLASSWVVDDHGMRGVIWQQSYLGRSSPGFYRGAARDNWEYEVRDEAVVRDAEGEPIIISNMGEDWVEIGAAWQAMEDASVRKNAKIQIRAIGPFDADSTQEEMVIALRHFCKTVLEPLGLPYSAVLHAPPAAGDQRNFHPHISFSLRLMRRVAPYCWDVADEVRGELDGKDGVQMLRHLWAHSMSEAAEQANRAMRYTGLGYGARGLNLEGGEHLGEGKSAMVARGTQVWAWERNRIRNARNAIRLAIRDADRKIAALTKIRDAAIAHMESVSAINPPRRLVTAFPALTPPASLRRSVAPKFVSKPMASPSVVDANQIAVCASVKAPQGAVTPMLHQSQPLSNALVIKPAPVDFEPTLPPIASPSPEVPYVVPALTAAATSASRSTSHRVAGASKAVDRAAPLHNAGTPNAAEPKRLSATGLARITRLAASLTDNGQPPSLIPAIIKRPAVDRKRLDLVAARQMTEVPPILTQIESLRFSLARRRKRRDEAARDALARRDDAVAASSSNSAERAAAKSPATAEAERSPSSPTLERSERRVVSDVPAAIRAAHWRRDRLAGAGRAPRPSTSPGPHLPSRAWLEANPNEAWSAERYAAELADQRGLDRLRRMDSYVADLHDGTFDVDHRALAAIGADAAWMRKPYVRKGLAAIRADQQLVVSTMAIGAERRPLDFARAGTRFWPRDLADGHLARLDRWAVDPGFQQDVFAIERVVRTAYLAHDAKTRRSMSEPEPVRLPASGVLTPDGFGGVRATPPPVYKAREFGPTVLAFGRTDGRPSRSLLMLLRHCGEHPLDVAYAEDGRLMMTAKVPTVIDPLLPMWRHDAQVEALVAATVRASREAGRPVYPREHAAAIRALSPAPTVTQPTPSGRDHGPGR